MSIGRLATIAILVVLASFVLAGPGLRWILKNEIQQSLGVRFESMQDAHVSLTGEVEAHKLVVKTSSDNPDSTHATDTIIDRVHFQISPQQLLRRRIMIEGAVASGVHFGVLPKASHCLTDGSVPTQFHPLDWFPSSILGGQVSDVWTEFQRSTSIEEESRKTEAKWSASIERLKLEQDTIEQRIVALRSASTDTANPLRDAELLRQKIVQSKELTDQLARLKSSIAQTAIDIKGDRNQVVQAQQNDLKRLTSNRSANGLDAKAIARSILIELGRSTLAHVDTSLQALSGSPLQCNSASNTPLQRGDSSLFDSLSNVGRFNLKRAKWDGDVTIGSEEFQIEGLLQGITTRADLHVQVGNGNRPSKISSSARSKDSELHFTAIQLHNSNDTDPYSNSNTNHWDTYEITSPRFGFSNWRLGNHQGMQIIGNGEPLVVHVRSFLSEGQKRTEIHVEQSRLRLNIEGTASDAGQRLSHQLASALSSATELNLTAEVEGDPSNDDHWRVESNLELPLEEGLRDALRSEIAFHEATLREQYRIVSSAIDERLERLVATQNGKLVSEVTRLQGELQLLTETIIAKLEGNRGTRFARESKASVTR